MATSTNCDKCNRMFTSEQMKASCPSQAPVMEVSVGHHTEPFNGEGGWYSRVGATLGDLCKFCQGELITYLQTTYPKFKEVSFRD